MKEINHNPKYYVLTGFQFKHHAVNYFKNKINHVSGACYAHYMDKETPETLKKENEVLRKSLTEALALINGAEK